MAQIPFLLIRPATESDLEAIRGIYNHEIVTGTVIYDYDPRTPGQVVTWYADKMKAGMPVLVAEINSDICGFCSYGIFRPRMAYRFSIEHTIYVASGYQGKGIGSVMMEELIRLAKKEGYHTMIAGIDGSNAGSIRFHERFGFTHVATLSEVGFKFERWLDLVFMQRMLTHP